MTHYIKLLSLSVLGVSILGFGCKKFVEIPPPTTELVTTNVFNDASTATAAQTAIYTSMFLNGAGFGIEINTGLSSDELQTYFSGSYFFDLYTNTLNAINDGNSLSGQWSGPYNYIYQANAVIAGLQNNSGVDTASKRQLTGEAEFIRAFWYFYLVNTYGDVPLLTTTAYQTNSVASRTPMEKVYSQIVADLIDAQKLLSPNFVDETDTAVSQDHVRPTKWAATAFLARVYLYTGDYKDAAIQAGAVINSGQFSLVPDPNQVFLENSNEAIWQLMPPPGYYATSEGTLFILTTSPGNSSAGAALSPQFLNAFDSGDLRRIDWVDSIIVSGSTYYYPYKYKADMSSTTLTEYGMVLRLSEQYLIRAEAEAADNDLTDATSDVNTIRNRAGLGNLPNATTTDLQLMLLAIQHERQVELFTEWGDRWFNLKRTNALDSVMTMVNPQKGGTGWQSFQQLYPIPTTDIQNDPNLKQTPGY